LLKGGTKDCRALEERARVDRFVSPRVERREMVRRSGQTIKGKREETNEQKKLNALKAFFNDTQGVQGGRESEKNI